MYSLELIILLALAAVLTVFIALKLHKTILLFTRPETASCCGSKSDSAKPEAKGASCCSGCNGCHIAQKYQNELH